MKHILLIIFLTIGLFGETKDSTPRQSANGTVLPSACDVGQTFFKTDAPVGLNWYGCTSPNTWTLLGKSPVSVVTQSPQSPTSTAFIYNNTSGALTVDLPAITADNIGIQVCVRNYTGKTGTITFDAPDATSIDVDGENTTVGGTLVSGGGLGDSACVVGVAAGQYMAYTNKGTWTKN